MNTRSTSVHCRQRLLFTILAVLAIAVSACAGDGGSATTDEEESGAMLALDESYDAVRYGARLALHYDAQSNSFVGFVENTTKGALKQVRVEVHLSNGVELGPTTPADLRSGERIDVHLAATGKDFDGWTAHPEVGAGRGGEHGRGEGDGEHGEGDGEHGGGGEGGHK